MTVAVGPAHNDMQQLFIECECCRQTAVTPAQCGGSVACMCGRILEVPHLRQLRADNGLGNLSAIDRLNVLGRSGPLRLGKGCVICSTRQGNTHELLLECQKPQIFGEANWLTNLVVMVLGGFGRLLHMNEQRQLIASGEERIVRCAIEVCNDCFESNAKVTKELIEAIRKIPEINDLFLEYPELEVCQLT